MSCHELKKWNRVITDVSNAHSGSNSGNAMYKSKDLVHEYLQQINKDEKVGPPIRRVLVTKFRTQVC